MCKKQKGLHNRIDKCMINLILNINKLHNRSSNWEIVGCCCGHGKYHMTIIVKVPINYPLNKEEYFYDLVSGIEIHRKRKFYVKDKQGYYYIPEVIKQ